MSAAMSLVQVPLRMGSNAALVAFTTAEKAVINRCKSAVLQVVLVLSLLPGMCTVAYTTLGSHSGSKRPSINAAGKSTVHLFCQDVVEARLTL